MTTADPILTALARMEERLVERMSERFRWGDRRASYPGGPPHGG
jgi:hypothetical protein